MIKPRKARGKGSFQQKKIIFGWGVGKLGIPSPLIKLDIKLYMSLRIIFQDVLERHALVA
jgi:hypothetical protein